MVATPTLGVNRTSTWAQYTVRVSHREAVAAALDAEGIPTAVHYPVPLHRQPGYAGRGLEGGDLSVAERLAREVLSLPMHPYLSEAAAELLRDAGAAFVGIDSLNIDALEDLRRPAHTVLLGAGIPICEHMTNLAALGQGGGRLHAVPIAWRGGASFPVRAPSPSMSNE